MSNTGVYFDNYFDSCPSKKYDIPKNIPYTHFIAKTITKSSFYFSSRIWRAESIIFDFECKQLNQKE